jgi:acetate kinase
MSDAIAVINGGSSSIKFSIFGDSSDEGLRLFCSGQTEGIGVAPRFKVKDPEGNLIGEQHWENRPEINYEMLLSHIIEWAREHFQDVQIKAVGHRVVHGGNVYSSPVVVNERVLAILEEFIPLAPLHQPHNLGPMATIARRNPSLLQVACFDTAFHTTNPPESRTFALPRDLTEEGVHRYGFHGLSYEYISRKLPEYDPRVARGRVVVAHLGSGASMCAIQGGRSVASTMGFSAVDGLPMGTRTGALDPGVVLYLMEDKGLDARAIESLLYEKSGLLGVSGISKDMRVLLGSDEATAKEAINLFVYRIKRELGSLAAAMEGLDALVFTAGIGENSPEIRARVCEGAEWLGVRLDPDANQQSGPRISTPDSPVSVWVIPTDEALMIAMHTRDVLYGGSQ